MMPRARKFARGYATVSVDDALNYRKISNIMTALGAKMNHASARNHLLRAMKKFATGLCEHYDVKLTSQEAADLARNPDFQRVVGQLIQDNLSSAFVEHGRKRRTSG